MVAAVQAEVPVMSIANYSASNNWGLFTKPGVPISLDTLKGKTISGFGDTWTEAMLPFVLKTAGLTKDDVKIVTVDDDTPLLLSGKVDISTNTTNYLAPAVLEATGQEPGVLLAKDAGAPNVPIWVYAASSSFLAANGEVASAWLEATRKATEWAIANPEDAVTAFERAYPQNGYSHGYNVAAWQATIEVLKNPAGELFTQSDAQWTELANALQSTGAIKQAAAPSKYYTNEYIGQ
jgi:ABC-type nitrate/sulfonate/bicarbonate transport system substrate-binding protein